MFALLKRITRVAAATVVTTAGLGLAGLGAAAVAQAQPAPFPDYHWCPGEYWDSGWGDATPLAGPVPRGIWHAAGLSTHDFGYANIAPSA